MSLAALEHDCMPSWRLDACCFLVPHRACIWPTKYMLLKTSRSSHTRDIYEVFIFQALYICFPKSSVQSFELVTVHLKKKSSEIRKPNLLVNCGNLTLVVCWGLGRGKLVSKPYVPGRKAGIVRLRHQSWQ